VVIEADNELPREWGIAWVSNMRLIISWQLPYVWGGESKQEGGYDCSGFVFASAPQPFRFNKSLAHNPLRRSTSARMEQGMDGWSNVTTDYPRLHPLDLGFVDGHVFAVVEGSASGLFEIAHSRSSKGPIEEPMPNWLWVQNPRFKRLTIGE